MDRTSMDRRAVGCTYDNVDARKERLGVCLDCGEGGALLAAEGSTPSVVADEGHGDGLLFLNEEVVERIHIRQRRGVVVLAQGGNFVAALAAADGGRVRQEGQRLLCAALGHELAALVNVLVADLFPLAAEVLCRAETAPGEPLEGRNEAVGEGRRKGPPRALDAPDLLGHEHCRLGRAPRVRGAAGGAHQMGSAGHLLMCWPVVHEERSAAPKKGTGAPPFGIGRLASMRPSSARPSQKDVCASDIPTERVSRRTRAAKEPPTAALIEEAPGAL